MSKRIPLRKNDSITLVERRTDGTAEGSRRFRIEGVKSEGGSVVCYYASVNESKGILREYYPFENDWVSRLERCEDGHLAIKDGDAEKKAEFDRDADEYAAMFKELNAKLRDEKHRELESFIPKPEIYYGSAEDGSRIGTVYVFTNAPAYMTFQQLCEKTRDLFESKPEKNNDEAALKELPRKAEKQLSQILKAIRSLVYCVQGLHSAGFYHRDISPDNFGFEHRRQEPLPESVWLFDVNSFCPAGACGENDPRLSREFERDGYSENAVFRNVELHPPYSVQQDYQADIFSIGACLFSAVIVNDTVKNADYKYRAEYFDRIKELLDTSALITASEENSYSPLRNRLFHILRRCLCPRDLIDNGGEVRYSACEELLKDLDAALAYSLRADASVKPQPSNLAIQYHLYEHPVYEYAPSDGDMFVLLLGLGSFGRTFLDQCLQMGQMLSKKLNVIVVNNEASDWDEYCEYRPELGRFFSVHTDAGAISSPKDAYGDICFLRREMKKDSARSNETTLKPLFDIFKPCYVFIAMGSDVLNENTARVCRKLADRRRKVDPSYACGVNYVLEHSDASAENKKRRGRRARPDRDPTDVDAVALRMYEDVKKKPFHRDIERMAFNSHLIWNKKINVSFESVRKEYLKPYNHKSCVASVLSIKSKLYSLGIDLDQEGYARAAALFKEKCTGAYYDDLIWIEHKRWVIEKICEGWRQMVLPDSTDDKSWIINHKDEDHKLHACICRSVPAQTLRTEWTEKHPGWWDRIKLPLRLTEAKLLDEFNKLDELEQMSVRLYQLYLQQAREIRANNPVYGGALGEIRAKLESDPMALTDFSEWYGCIIGIVNGDAQQGRYYEGRLEKLKKNLDRFPMKNRAPLEESINSFDKKFKPIIPSLEKRDFKQEDVALVEKIPFILNYSADTALLVPFFAERDPQAPNAILNITAATALNPAQLIYASVLDDRYDFDCLKGNVRSVLRYMKRKMLRAKIDFLFLCSRKLPESLLEGIREDLCGVEKELLLHEGPLPSSEEAPDLRIRCVETVRYGSLFDLSKDAETKEAFLRKLKKLGRGRYFLAAEFNRSAAAGCLKELGVYDHFPVYEYNVDAGDFTDRKGCEMLTNLLAAPFVSITDLLYFRGYSGFSEIKPEFSNVYQEVWNLLRGKKSSYSWKALGKLLTEHSRKTEPKWIFKTQPDPSKLKERPDRICADRPSFCFEALNKIVRFLVENKIADAESCVQPISADTCRVVIFDRIGYKKLYEDILSDPYRLADARSVGCYMNRAEKPWIAAVKINSMQVSGVTLAAARAENPNGEEQITFAEILKKLQNLNLIYGLTFTAQETDAAAGDPPTEALDRTAEDGTPVNSSDGTGAAVYVPQTVSFNYVTAAAKDLIQTEGRALEYAVYYRAKNYVDPATKEGFDDVAVSCEILWDESDFKNEFDCIVVKGFRMLLIECKATVKLERGHYDKLKNLADRFGVKAKVVLISDPGTKVFGKIKNENERLVNYGGELDIITVESPKEINEIGKTLYRIMTGDYPS